MREKPAVERIAKRVTRSRGTAAEERYRFTEPQSEAEGPWWLVATRFAAKLLLRAGMLFAAWCVWLSAAYYFRWPGFFAGWLGAAAVLWLADAVHNGWLPNPARVPSYMKALAVYFAAAALALHALPTWASVLLALAAGLTPTLRLFA